MNNLTEISENSQSTQNKDKEDVFTLCDDLDRPCLIIKKGRAFIPRYPDSDRDIKDIVIEFLKDMTSMDIEYISNFLDYKEEQDEFCS